MNQNPSIPLEASDEQTPSDITPPSTDSSEGPENVAEKSPEQETLSPEQQAVQDIIKENELRKQKILEEANAQADILGDSLAQLQQEEKEKQQRQTSTNNTLSDQKENGEAAEQQNKQAMQENINVQNHPTRPPIPQKPLPALPQKPAINIPLVIINEEFIQNAKNLLGQNFEQSRDNDNNFLLLNKNTNEGYCYTQNEIKALQNLRDSSHAARFLDAAGIQQNDKRPFILYAPNETQMTLLKTALETRGVQLTQCTLIIGDKTSYENTLKNEQTSTAGPSTTNTSNAAFGSLNVNTTAKTQTTPLVTTSTTAANTTPNNNPPATQNSSPLPQQEEQKLSGSGMRSST